jgi:hypothetical protein
MKDPTALQQIISEEGAEQLIDELENLDGLMPEGEGLPAKEGWEIAFDFDINDVPVMLEELREVVEDGE